MFLDSFSKKQKILIVVVTVATIVLLVLAGLHTGRKQSTKTGTITDAQPPTTALKVVASYIQAREDSVGDDQPSPVSWLATVKPIVTEQWFAQLQPPGTVQTSSTPHDYTVAHDQHYTVKAVVSACLWDRHVASPTDTSGAVICSVYDNTIGADGRVISSDSLPFGWTATGQQQPAILKIVSQHGSWLVDEDVSGQGA